MFQADLKNIGIEEPTLADTNNAEDSAPDTIVNITGINFVLLLTEGTLSSVIALLAAYPTTTDRIERTHRALVG